MSNLGEEAAGCGLSPRLGEDEPKPRTDDVERCDFGAHEIAMLKAERDAYIRRLDQSESLNRRTETALETLAHQEQRLQELEEALRAVRSEAKRGLGDPKRLRLERIIYHADDALSTPEDEPTSRKGKGDNPTWPEGVVTPEAEPKKQPSYPPGHPGYLGPSIHEAESE